jgi:hypothetical protein
MRQLVPLLLMLLILPCLLALQPDDQANQTQPASAPAMAQRVILRVNRNVEVMGHVQVEDDDIITVRNRRGELESFAKSRILQIVRLVEPQPGQTAMVVLRDGDIREGILLEDAFEHVRIEIQGIVAKLRRQDVDHVVLQPTFEQRYAQAKAALQPGMHDAHLTLCRWLFDQRRYELARTELLELLEGADMPEARTLLNVVDAQLAMSVKPSATTQPKDAVESEDSDDRNAGPVYPADLMPTELITHDDVNVIRVYEIDFDHPPKVTIPPDTVRALIEQYGTNKLIPDSQTGRHAMFRAAADRPLELVRLMFELRARDLYPKIEVNTEPYAMNLFRQRVHDTWLMNNCATSRCHGGPYAGDLFLHRKNYKDERVRYTNFLILERLKLDPEWPLINYDRPEDSLIIQYGLPAGAARKPHPKANGWKPAFPPINAKLKEEAVEWILAMMQPRPDYPVKYVPPKLGGDQPDETAEAPQPPR